MRRRTVAILVVIVILLLAVGLRHRRQRMSEQESHSLSSSSTASLSAEGKTPSAQQNFSLGAGTYERSIQFGGQDRTYRIHVPPSYDPSTPHALVIAIHGGGGDIESAERSMGWDREANQEGFLVVYPQGTGTKLLGKTFGTWNGGICCGDAAKKNIDDVGFMRAMIDAIAEEFNLDPNRVYATGISNGGMMSYRLACDLSDRIAAIGPVAGQFDGGQRCIMKRPVPILHLHGLADPCAKMEGGTCGGCFNDYLEALHIPAKKNDTWQCTPVPSTLAIWAKRNGCSQQTSVVSNANGVKCISYGCPSNATTELCTIEGMGHQWPGGDNKVPSCTTKPNGLVCQEWKKTVGPESDALNGTHALWKFFQAHPMK